MANDAQVVEGARGMQFGRVNMIVNDEVVNDIGNSPNFIHFFMVFMFIWFFRYET